MPTSEGRQRSIALKGRSQNISMPGGEKNLHSLGKDVIHKKKTKKREKMYFPEEITF